MEFSMTEQQIPMLLRIINLAIALQQRQLKKPSNVDIVPGSAAATDEGIYVFNVSIVSFNSSNRHSIRFIPLSNNLFFKGINSLIFPERLEVYR